MRKIESNRPRPGEQLTSNTTDLNQMIGWPEKATAQHNVVKAFKAVRIRIRLPERHDAMADRDAAKNVRHWDPARKRRRKAAPMQVLRMRIAGLERSKGTEGGGSGPHENRSMPNVGGTRYECKVLGDLNEDRRTRCRFDCAGRGKWRVVWVSYRPGTSPPSEIFVNL
jgi:hypothetical protein